MTKLRMGIIGVGGIAQERHIPAFLQLQDKVTLMAVNDMNKERADEVAKKYNIPHVFSTYHELFAVVDAVTICTPNKFHAEISIAALNAGVHVFCEKPMAITTEECERMIEASQKVGKLLSIGYHYRYTEVSQIAKRAVMENQIGDPLVTRVQALRRRKVPGWGVFTNKELQGGGSLIDFGCHLLDLSIWLLGDPEPVEVIGKTYNRLSKSPIQINDWGSFNYQTFEVDDHVSAYITFENDISVLFECSWAANIKEDKIHLSVSGAEGGLNMYPFELYQPKLGSMMETTAKAEHNEKRAGVVQAENFVNSCLGESELVVKPEQAMKVSKIIEAIYQSSESGTSVKLS
ncbi:dehydrogenase [Virgibacillus halodenitrificans]|uniref:Dehydrogenase n=1 Tax=Virgibacillus halodenitrificans TaxID=1482 RepID=A0AAC9J2P8_VIRHA|nr:Gfo/Idh/MocA family oxidoreductase [Virgibacillus halodenitrificans]APC49467.1 dehydrogenase [Virgibacillus halodenitrificans]MCJ0929883.1 Gfo/Idh/MocA family oxidoreductase [Virgibacillus halodenitrificans]